MNHQLLFSGVTAAVLLAACAAHNSVPAQHGQRPASPNQTPVARYHGLAAPASVLYDAEADRYLVSNVNGAPLAKDDNGYISVLSPDGRVVTSHWIAGGKNGVHLDAPKGLAIADGVLYVADISVVRTFDAETGAPRADIAVPGSTYLKDLATDPDGNVYLSDAGAPYGRFDAKGTEAVYAIEDGRARKIADGKLGRPDGIAWTEDGLVVCPFGASEIYRLDARGAKKDVTKTPAGGLSGIVRLRDGSLLVTSWQASSVFRGKLGGRFEVALADQGSPADIGYDTKRSRLLVPNFTAGTLDAFELE